MATTKQYNDLQDGGNIQTGDKIAVARAGASELLTVPAESLAQRAAEIVSTDQMQEFVADLGLGKQVLAQALNNKGAGVTAADTLAQMAGKVDALDVVGAKEYIVGDVFETEVKSSDVSVVVQAGFCSRNAIKMSKGKIEIIKPSDTGEDYVAASYIDEEIGSLGTYSYSNLNILTTSANGRYILAMPFSSDSTGIARKAFILEADYENDSLSLVKTIEYTLTKISTTFSAYYIYMSNDGTKAFVASTYSSVDSVFFDITAGTSHVVSGTTLPPANNSFSRLFAYDIGNKIIAFSMGYRGGYTLRNEATVFSLQLNWEQKNISVIGQYNLSSQSCRKSFPDVLENEQIAFFALQNEADVPLGTTSSETFFGHYLKNKLIAMDLNTFQVIDSINILFLPRKQDSFEYSCPLFGLVSRPVIIKTNEGNSAFVSVGFVSNIEFDLIEKKFKQKNTNFINGDQYTTCLIYRNLDTSTLATSSDSYPITCATYTVEGRPCSLYHAYTSNGNQYGSGSGIQAISKILNKFPQKMLGVFIKRNAKSTPLFMQTIKKDDLEAGAYDVENSSAVVQLNEEVEQ